MKVFIIGGFRDLQTGPYIAETFNELKDTIAIIDSRENVKVLGLEDGNANIVKETKDLAFKPDLILILKGAELTYESIKAIKESQPQAKLVNWFFDKYFGDKPIWEQTSYFETIKLFDYYVCSLKGVSDKLKEAGLANIHYIDEACYPLAHKDIYLNSYQKQKYGSDVSFCGSIGLFEQHTNRIPILSHVASNGYDLKIWGDVVCEMKYVPNELRSLIQGRSVVNEDHSKVVQSSLINLGIDQDISIELGHSARLYRVLCAGGLYLTNATKGLEKMFIINKKDEPISPEQDLVVFYDNEDLVKKIDVLLEDALLREKIAENGKKKVLEFHTFKNRIEEMKKLIGGN